MASLMMLTVAVTAAAADPLVVGWRASQLVKILIEIPTSAPPYGWAIGVGQTGALIESTGSTYGVIVRWPCSQAPTPRRCRHR